MKDEYNTPSIERVRTGFANLSKHIENIQKFDLQPVVAINSFPSDTLEEVALIQELCKKYNVDAVVSNGWAKGGDGMTELAEAVVSAVENHNKDFKLLYDWRAPIKEKIETIACEIYGAKMVDLKRPNFK